MKFLAPIIFSIAPSLAIASDFQIKDLPIVCGATEHVFKGLVEKYKEVPVMTYKAEIEVTTTVWVNYQEKTSSITISHTNGTSCLISAGEEVKFLGKLI